MSRQFFRAASLTLLLIVLSVLSLHLSSLPGAKGLQRQGIAPGLAIQPLRQDPPAAPITVTGFNPPQIMRGQPQAITVYGANFTANSVIELGGFGTLATSVQDAGTLTAQLPDNLPAGQYTVIVNDPQSGPVTAPGILQVDDPPTDTPTATLTPTNTPTLTPTITLTPTLTSTPTATDLPPLKVTRSEPIQIIGGQEAKLSVFGEGFSEGATVRLVGFGLLTTQVVHSGALIGTIPANLPAGTYKVQVDDPIGGHANSPNTLNVLAPTSTPPPTPEPSDVPTLYPTSEPPTPVPGQPVLTVRNFTASPALIEPGGTVMLALEVVNQGNRTAQGISIAVDAGSKFVPANGQASVIAPDLEPGGSTMVQLAVDVTQDAAAGPNVVPLTLNFRDFSGQTYSNKASLSVTISGSTATSQVVLTSYTLQPNAALPGEVVTLTGQVTNTGSATASQVLLRVAGTDNVLLAGPQGDSLPLGDLAAGASVPITLQLVVSTEAKPGPQPQPFTISYLQNDESKEAPGSITLEVEKKVTAAPLLLLESYDAGTDVLKPGEMFTLSLTLQNVGKGSAEELLVTFGTVETTPPDSGSGDGSGNGGNGNDGGSTTTTPGTVFAPIGGGGTIYVGTLGAEGEEVKLEQKFIVNGTVTSGIYNLPITLRYQKPDGTTGQSSLPASLVIVALPNVQITLNSPIPEMVNAGEPFMIDMTIKNNGSATFNLIKATIEAENADVFDGQEVLLGPVKTDEDTSLTGSVAALEEGPVRVTVTIYYRNDLNQEATLVQVYETEAMLPPPPEDMGEMPPDIQPTATPEEEVSVGDVIMGLLGLGS